MSRIGGRCAAALIGAAAGLGVASAPASAAPVTTTFAYTGGEQTYVVPAGVTRVTVDASGAAGSGTRGGNARPGGRGGRVVADLAVTPGTTLYVQVGGPAWGGGGGVSDAIAGPGGGASDVRTCPVAGPCDTLASRLVVAGGGGGAGGNYGGGSPVAGIGGPGGLPADAGGDGAGSGGTATGGLGGRPGTQVAGGTGGPTPPPGGNPGGAGTFGTGGAGGTSAERGGGGGGGGWYGGGGGSGANSGYGGGGGGGGSSHVVASALASTVHPAGATSAGVSISYAGPELALDASTRTFGAAGSERTVTLTNTGGAPLTLAAPVVAGPQASSFGVSATTCGATLAAGGSCAATVRFAPVGAGPAYAVLTLGGPDATGDVVLVGDGGPLPAGSVGPAGSPGPAGPAGPAGRGADTPSAAASSTPRVLTTAARIVRGRVAVQVACPAASGSAGVTLRTAGRVGGARRTLGAATFRCRPNARLTVRVKVRSSVARLLRGRRVAIVAQPTAAGTEHRLTVRG